MERCIQSVLAQTFSDWELIFVDDFSQDGSLAIAQKFADQRIAFYQREIPGPGGYAARNFGIDKASGDWVCFLDADDEWRPEYLQTLHSTIKENRGVRLFGTAWKNMNAGTGDICPISRCFQNGAIEILSFHTFLSCSVQNCPPLWTSAVAVDLSLIREVGGFPEGMCKSGGDVDTWFRLTHYTNAVGFINTVGVYYHTDSENMVTRTLKSFEVPCLVHSVRSVLGSAGTDEKKLLKQYSNKYLLAQIAKSIRSGRFNIDLISYFFSEVEPLKYRILILFKSKLFRSLYRIYLTVNNPFYGK